MSGGVYQIKCTTTERAYYGSSTSIDKRLNQHLRMLRRGTHHSKPLQQAWNKYGEACFEFSTIAYLEDGELLSSEQRLLDYAFAQPLRPYNCAKNSLAPMKGRNHSDMTKSMVSLANTGSGNPFYGMQHTDETKQKISRAKKGQTPPNLGKQMSDEVKLKISNSKRGKPSSKKGIFNSHCKRGHPFDSENTYLHRSRRECKKCRAEASARFKESLITKEST